MWKRSIEILISYKTNSDNTEETTSSSTTASATTQEAAPLVITQGNTATTSGTYNEVIRISQNRVDFKYVSTLGAAADTLKIDIYNLSPDTLASLMDERVKSITMLVGYEDQEMSVLLEGFISNVAGRRAIPNHITSIWAVPKFQYMLSQKAPINKTVVKYGRVVDVINSLCLQIGFSAYPKYYNMTDEVLQEYIQGYVFDGTPKQALRNLGAQYGFFVKPTNNTVNIVARLSATDSCSKLADGRITKHVLAMNKVKGVPEASIGAMDIRYNLSPEITAGDIMDCVSLIGAGNEGKPLADSIINVNAPNNIMYRSDALWKSMIYQLYLIKEVVHVGSNYSSTWDTMISGTYYVGGTACKNPGNGDPGFNGVGAPDIDTEQEVKSIPSVKTSVGGSDEFTDKWVNDASNPPPPNIGGDQNYDEPAGRADQDLGYDTAQKELQPDAIPYPRNTWKGYEPNGSPADNKRRGIPDKKAPSRISQGGNKQAGTLSPAWNNLANIVGAGEGGYDIAEGGVNLGLSNMTIGQVKAEQQKVIDRRDKRTPAMGRYQQMPEALRENQASVGLSDDDKFSVENQDKMFQASILKKRDLEEHINGSEDLPDREVSERIAKEYASVKTMDGTGYYDKDGVNNATIEASIILNAIEGIREEQQQGG